MPCSEHRQIVLVEVVDGLGVVHDEFVVRDLVDPRVNDLTEQLTTGLATYRLGDYADSLLGFDEAERHCNRKVRATPDGKRGICATSGEAATVKASAVLLTG